jgi:GT2 family glycosyltransferase
MTTDGSPVRERLDAAQLDVTVLLPTIGRAKLLESCLASLAQCKPRADEILVLDSSHDSSVSDIVAAFAHAGARRIRCQASGIGAAFNAGLREARHEIVLLTNDDCTLEPTWVERGVHHARHDPGSIVTGRVRPFGDPAVVPSTIDDPVEREYAQKPAFVLFTQSMAVHRSRLLEFGGFDERIQPSAEDNDLSYRWLKAGLPIRYEPDFVAWHHDWRSPEQLARLYVDYGIGQGMVYGKHLRRGDVRVVSYLVTAIAGAARARLAQSVGRYPRAHADPRLGFVRGLRVGLVRGWRIGRESS